jgi:hypothetical protein
LQHQDNAEIAGVIGKTEHQVRGLCHKAIEKLQAVLSPAADEPQNRGRPP